MMFCMMRAACLVVVFLLSFTLAELYVWVFVVLVCCFLGVWVCLVVCWFMVDIVWIFC